MKSAVLSLVFCACLAGCAQQSTIVQVEPVPPPMVVANGIQALVDQHAERAAFARFVEGRPSPKPLRSFAEVEQVTSGRSYSSAERREQQAWFRAAASVWHYTFAEQYEGILFTDASGHVQHAILLG